MERAPARAALRMPCRAVGVGGHMGAVGGRLLDRGRQLGLGDSSGAPGPGPEGEHGPGGDHLDEVGPAVQDRPHPLPDLRRGGRLPEAEVAGQLDVGGQAGDGPAAPGDGDVRAGHRHPRADHGAVADRVAQGHVDERPEGADVAHGREPGHHGGPRVADPAERLLGGAAVDRRDARALELAHQVGVAVDQPREQRVPGQVEHRRPVGRRTGRGRAAPRSAPPGPAAPAPPGPSPASTSTSRSARSATSARRPVAIPRLLGACPPPHDDRCRFPIGSDNP